MGTTGSHPFLNFCAPTMRTHVHGHVSAGFWSDRNVRPTRAVVSQVRAEGRDGTLSDPESEKPHASQRQARMGHPQDCVSLPEVFEWLPERRKAQRGCAFIYLLIPE